MKDPETHELLGGRGRGTRILKGMILFDGLTVDLYFSFILALLILSKLRTDHATRLAIAVLAVQSGQRQGVQLAWECLVNYGFPLDNFTACKTGGSDVPARTAEQERQARKKARAKARAKAEGTRGPGGERQSSGEGKGAAGKGVQIEALEREQATSPSSKQAGYLISSREYVQAARFLAAKAVSVPVEFMRLLQRCIRERIRAFRYYCEDEPSESHLQFIQVLQEVQAVLEPLVKSTKKASTAPREVEKATQAQTIELANRFTALSSDEENEEDIPDIDLPKPPKPDDHHGSPPIEFAVASEAQDLVLDILLFYADVHTLRAHIKGLWRDVLDGRIELHTAAVTMNIALALLRKSASAFSPYTIDNLCRHGVLPVLNSVVKVFAMYDIHPAGRSSSELQERVQNYFIFPVLVTLSRISEIVKDGDLPLIVPGWFGNFDPWSCGTGTEQIDKLQKHGVRETDEKPSFKTQWKHNSILLHELLVEYHHFLKIGRVIIDDIGQEGNQFFVDEIAVEMHAFVAGGGKPTLLLLAFSQFLIDIHEVMRDETHIGHERLREVANHAFRTLSLRHEIERPHAKPPTYTLGGEKAIRYIEEDLEVLGGKDPILRLYESNALTWGPGGRRALEENYKCTFLDRNPFFCGLLIFRIRVQYQTIGSSMMCQWNSVRLVGHLVAGLGLYDDVRVANSGDLRGILDLYGENNLFYDAVPRDAHEALRSLLLSHSYTEKAVRMICDFPQTRSIPAGIKPGSSGSDLLRPKSSVQRQFIEYSGVTTVFREKYTRNAISAGSPVDMVRLQSVLVDLLRKEEKAKKEAQAEADREDGHGQDGWKVKPLRLRKARKHKSDKFSLTQLLSVVEAGIESESTIIALDWLATHLQCLRVLKAVHTATSHLLTRKTGNVYLCGDMDMLGTVPRILEASNFHAYAQRHNSAGKATEASDGAQANWMEIARKAVLDALAEPL